MAKKSIVLKGKALAKRLTGIACPIGGISWKPPVDEQDKSRRLLTYLEDRRALYQPYDMEVGPYVVKSILDIRERLTADLEEVSKSSVLGESLVAMRAACRDFLNKTQVPDKRGYFMGAMIISALGSLRAVLGIHIARVACAYDLEVTEPLASAVPADPDDDGGTGKKKKTTAKIARRPGSRTKAKKKTRSS
jgi:hypothetical protein